MNDKRSLRAYAEAIGSNIRITLLDKHLTILWANERFCKLTQYSEEELIGQPIDKLKLIRPDAHRVNSVFSTIPNGEKWSGELKGQAKDGSSLWIRTTILPVKNENGEIESYLLLNSNIMATKLALEEKNLAMVNLTHSEARYRALVENQSDLISLCKADGTQVYANASYCRFVGKTPEELVGTHLLEGFIKDLPLEFLCRGFSLTPESPEALGVFELEDANSEKWWISLCVKGVFDSDGNLYEILTIGRDVTELKQAELHKSNEIDALGRIAFMTSHHVRGPIVTMLGLIELLRITPIYTDEWNQILNSFKKCIVDLDFCTRELGAFIYQRQSSK